VHGKRLSDGAEFRVEAGASVIASGGICGGDLSKVRANWYRPWGDAPELLLNGAHRFGDGLLHEAVDALGGRLTHLDKQWHYAAGVPNPDPQKEHDGLSLVPPRSALWFNALGERIMNPGPLVPYTDTRHLVRSILEQPGKYSWQVMNWKIAIKELAVSGCDYMTAFRFKKRLAIVKDVLFGNKALVERLIAECPDNIVVADSIEDLAAKMTAKNHYGLEVDPVRLAGDVRAYDQQIEMGPAFHNDEQLRWIASYRQYRGDRIRTCNFQRIDDRGARPLIAIKEFILSRKSLGGIQTDLSCRVQDDQGSPIPGLYAVGEAAGFGGGGIHGKGSLEGTFLGGCVLTGRMAAQAIAKA
jgi:predicted oxidoreductase